MTIFADIEAISPDVSIYGRRSDQKALDRLFGSRFALAWSRVDRRHATVVIDDLAWDEMALAFQMIRESFLIYGDVYILAGGPGPHLKTDAAVAHRFFEIVLSHSFELWVCDPGFRWCVEVRSNGTMSFIRSPYDRLLRVLRARACFPPTPAGSAPSPRR